MRPGIGRNGSVPFLFCIREVTYDIVPGVVDYWLMDRPADK